MSQAKAQTEGNRHVANPFCGKAEEPTAKELAAALREAKPVWDQLLRELDRELGVSVHEWRCYSPKTGWSLRVKRKARTIVWLGPRENGFMVLFILGDKALHAALSSQLPAPIIKAIQRAPKYPEGTGVRIPMKTTKEIPSIMTLAAVKIAN